MTAETTYNGWTNYETWNVALWLDTDQGTYNYVREMAEEVREDESETPTVDLADRIKDFVDEMTPEMGPSMFSDLLNAALSEVNYREIAENVLSELAETS